MRIPVKRATDTRPSGLALQAPSGEGGTPEAFGFGLGRSIMNLAGQTAAFNAYVQEQEQQRVRFEALRRLSQFQQQQRLQAVELKRNATPGTQGFYDIVSQSFSDAEREFLSTIPPELQGEFSVRTAELGASLGLDAMEHQYSINDTYFKQGIQDALNEARVEIGQDGSPENLERQRALVHEAIESSGLSDAEKIAITRQADQGVEAVAYRQAQLQRLRDEQSGIGTDVSYAAELLQQFSGMSPDDASRAALEGMRAAQAAVGSVDTWAALPQRIRAVLTSVAAQQGGLSDEVLATLGRGDFDALAEVIRAQGNESEGDLILNPEAGIDNDPAFNNLPYEDRLVLLQDAERQVAAEISDAAQLKKESDEALINSLMVSLYDGTAGQADIDSLREAGILTDYEDIKRADEVLAKRDEELRLRQLGAQMMTGNVTFAPGNEEHMKVLNAMIGDEGLKALDEKDSDFAANWLLPIVRQTQAVPSNAVDVLRGMIRSQDPDKAYWALDLMGQIERASPKGFLQFNEDDRRDLDFWQARRDYMNQEDLLKSLRGPVDPAERNARTALRKEGMQLFTAENGPMKSFDARSLFTGAPGWFFGMPQGVNPPWTKWVNQQLNDDFETLFLDNYERFGDMEQAKQAATKQLQRVWGVTNVGQDSTLMKYPPEMIYPPVREKHDWMEAQLIADGLLQPGETFQLITDTQTEDEWQTGLAPSYLFVKTLNGVSSVQQDAQGLPLRVYFDYGAAEQADEAKWREEQALLSNIADAERTMGLAVQHSLDTGMPIPQDMFASDQPGGFLDIINRALGSQQMVEPR